MPSQVFSADRTAFDNSVNISLMTLNIAVASKSLDKTYPV